MGFARVGLKSYNIPMRKYVFWILFLAIAVVLGVLLFPSKKAQMANTPVVLTSGYVPYTITQQLAGGNVSVQMLLPPGAEPHAFEPTPGALLTLKQAAAFIYVSDELEPWAADLAKAAGVQTRLVQLASTVPAGADPHIWMTFDNAKILAAQIAQVLEDIAPAHKEIFEKNLAKFNREMDQLSSAFQTALARCRSRRVVHVGHLAFKNLADAYHLQLAALSGTSHEGEHSAKKLAQLIKQIKESNVSAIFTEDTLSPRLAQTVAQETGAQILPLYPVEHISKEDFNHNVTYAELMHRNLESLKRGLQCPAP